MTAAPTRPTPRPGDGRRLIACGAVFALLAVVAGAFAAHGLRAQLSPTLLATWETAARYQMYHAFALLLCGVLAPRLPQRALGWSAALFVAGIVLFSGSLYLLAVTGIGVLGAVTPFGGMAWIAGWAVLAWAALARQSS